MTIGVLSSKCVSIYFNPIFCPKFKWLIWCIVKQVYYFFIFHYCAILLISNHLDFPVFLLDISFACWFVSVSELFCCKHFENFVILPAVLLPIKSPVACSFSFIFLIYLFEAILNASVADCIAWSRCSWLYLPLKFLLIILPIFLLKFLAKSKNHNLLQIFDL